MRKGQRTKARILRRAAELFNTRGYEAVSLGDVLEAAEIEKGGFYNHFADKDELRQEAFAYARDLFWERLLACGASDGPPLKRLEGLLSHFESQLEAPLLPGGCPFLNAAVEADASPSTVLRAPARRSMRRLLKLAESAFAEARNAGLLKRDAPPPAELATFWIASLEGAVMLSMIFGARRHMYRVTAQLRRNLRSLQRNLPK